MTLNNSLRISASGLAAERFRMDVISSNIANANSTVADGRGPYRRRDVQLAGSPDGVQVVRIIEDPRPFIQRHMPGHQSADANGMVLTSNVEPVEEMVNMIAASRAYEANIAAFNSAKGMIRSALNIGKL
jgi:flagellar basal-body rod protein FlgC